MYGGGRDAGVAWKVGQIMLRYRPIAPKPASAAGSPKISPAPTETRAGARRPKRKGCANPSGGGRGRKTGKVDTTTTTSSSMIVTLPLMPETPERQCDPAESPRKPSSPLTPAAAALPRVVPPWMGRKEWVTVACVTDSWLEEEVPWRSDEAVTAALALDESPGFVSDGWDRVMWTNEAYRRMVTGREAGEEQAEEVKVGLLTGGLVPAAAACRAFTCRVRVRPGRERTSSSPLAAPCDVWRLDSGGCAWRLDVKAALSLSL
ncbi:hypothetical protein MUK42_01965 [Musa troglodytarum]|uniref:DUF7950 domain-containing protein n=1 Tax=Musa troglodytarum TaxID=320322 RepID=A0A9E7FD41_9LILI|nr:hypothetical protein MUK42_01965 [Musa troglodytarum]